MKLVIIVKNDTQAKHCFANDEVRWLNKQKEKVSQRRDKNGWSLPRWVCSGPETSQQEAEEGKLV